ncbi:type II secretion system protein M [Protaetiibacter sp. SSC-01]|uniref:type 4a pilus biogenesis protein PilO n=1 Tax=Protaetiibacter sp. SSC-01 TaxID=2759943 RepID=UPI0016572E35|nr:type II secretion system protein M [Protaetiibacter sp. SSC-01]QNO37773.1 type II secretion system protein M [Protaetiibacter sp. SSC-01]
MKLSTQIWGLITVVVVVGVLAAGWFLGVSPQLTAQAQAESQRKTALAQNDSIRATIAELEREQDNLAAYKERDAQLQVAIPTTVDSADFITDLNWLAVASNVTIEQISINEVTPYTAPGRSTDEDLAPVTDSRINGDNFLLVPVSLSVSGGWNEVLAFTHGVQANGRLVLVTKVSTTGDGITFTTTLSGAMYVLLRPVVATAETADEGSDSDASAAG